MDLSPEKIFVVGVIALMVLGPERLPHVARTAGRMLAEVRRVSASVQHEVTNAIAEPRELLGQAAGENGFEDIRKALLAAPLSWRSALGEMVGGPTGHAPALTRPPAGADVEVAAAPAVAAEAPATALGLVEQAASAVAAPDDLSLN
jgi:sec-independent protein translocase protein TatB